MKPLTLKQLHDKSLAYLVSKLQTYSISLQKIVIILTKQTKVYKYSNCKICLQQSFNQLAYTIVTFLQLLTFFKNSLPLNSKSSSTQFGFYLLLLTTLLKKFQSVIRPLTSTVFCRKKSIKGAQTTKGRSLAAIGKGQFNALPHPILPACFMLVYHETPFVNESETKCVY